MVDEQQASRDDSRQRALEPLVGEQEDDDQTTEKRWTDALRPFSFEFDDAPKCVRIWQQLCLFIPVLLLFLWMIALALCMYWDPIRAITMCNIHLCWSIIEHGRIVGFGVIALKKVLNGSIEKGGTLASSAACIESGAADLHHAVYICAYKENTDVLRQTLLSVATQQGPSNGKSYASNHIGVCLCMEAREGEVGERMANQLVKEFDGQFEWMDISYHPDKLEGEIQGKCSNLQWAVNATRQYLTRDNILVTCGDADSLFDPRYFSVVSSKYVELGDSGGCTIFQPTVMHLLNIFEQSHVVRASSIFTTVVFAGTLEDKISSTLPYSTFTVESKFMKRFNGWDVDYLNDDWHTGTKAFVADPVHSQILHIPFPVVNCAVDADTWFGTWSARFKQAKRHALGVEELVYLLQMLPVCHQKLLHNDRMGLTDGPGGCCGMLAMYCRFTRIFLFVVSVHIRFAFIIPANVAMTAIMIGVWIQHHFSFTQHFPLYGKTPEHFLTSPPFRWNAGLSAVLFVIVLGKSFLAVRMVQHLVAVGRITGKLPWWAQSPIFQYIHNFVSMAIALPLVAFAGSLAEIIAIFRVAGWNKQSFEFYVAPKRRPSEEK